MPGRSADPSDEGGTRLVGGTANAGEEPGLEYGVLAGESFELCDP